MRLPLNIVATDTQFNGYQFMLHDDPPASRLPSCRSSAARPPCTINATATAIVGNQRQTPALLTLSNGNCAMNLKGGAQLTVLGDVYSNGTACVDSDLHEAGNCYGAAGLELQRRPVLLLQRDSWFHPIRRPLHCRRHPGRTGRAGADAPDPATSPPSVGLLPAAAGSTTSTTATTWTEMFPGSTATSISPADPPAARS